MDENSVKNGSNPFLADMVKQELEKGQIGPDRDCGYHPCHWDGQDCSLCYCPFYPCMDEELGKLVDSRKGGKVWSCQDCLWIHRPSVTGAIIELMGGQIPAVEELHRIKEEVERKHPKRARGLMVLGATSGAGKSLMVAALCRIFSNRGYDVSPFKSQNMSLNSMVTPNGEEMARIQVLQAMAARKEPSARMNPILVKPKGGHESQIVVEGRPYRDIGVEEYYRDFTLTDGMEIIRRNHDLLARTNDILVGEGAGSPAEINIYDIEIANMKTAEIMDAACILVVNIEWGGSFAHIYGTLGLLSEEHKAMFKGVIINNMRGNPDILMKGIERIEDLTGVPVLGVVPHIDLYLPDEDSMGLSSKRRREGDIWIGVVRLPHISNYTDFDALTLEKDVSVIFVESPDQIERLDGIIIPGSKNSVSDLKWMRETGMADSIVSMAGKVPILGICGGFQIMGRTIHDPENIEDGEEMEIEGLGLLDVETRFDSYEKRTVQVRGVLAGGHAEAEVRGYEIHMGSTDTRGSLPLFEIIEPDGPRPEGVMSKDGKCMGTYVHGLFDLPAFRRFFLGDHSKETGSDVGIDHDELVEKSIDSLATTVEESIDMDLLMSILGLR